MLRQLPESKGMVGLTTQKSHYKQKHNSSINMWQENERAKNE